MTWPGGWQFALLALAAFRLYRLVARDTISEPVRAALTYPDDQAVTLDSELGVAPPAPVKLPPSKRDYTFDPPHSWRVYASTLIRCHWCLGAWVSALWWVASLLWPHFALWASTPLALSAAVALVEKNLDA